MTKQELSQTIDDVVGILQSNKAAATPELLAQISQLLNEVQHNDMYLGVLGAVLKTDREGVLQLVDSVKQFESVEEQLVNTDLTDRIIHILRKVQNNGIVMQAIAWMLK